MKIRDDLFDHLQLSSHSGLEPATLWAFQLFRWIVMKQDAKTVQKIPQILSPLESMVPHVGFHSIQLTRRKHIS